MASRHIEPLARAIVAWVGDTAPVGGPSRPCSTSFSSARSWRPRCLPKPAARCAATCEPGRTGRPHRDRARADDVRHKWFVVEAGKPVQIMLSNPDAMPHNLMVGRPGSLQEVGDAGGGDAAADRSGRQAVRAEHAARAARHATAQGGETDRLASPRPPAGRVRLRVHVPRSLVADVRRDAGRARSRSVGGDAHRADRPDDARRRSRRDDTERRDSAGCGVRKCGSLSTSSLVVLEKREQRCEFLQRQRVHETAQHHGSFADAAARDRRFPQRRFRSHKVANHHVVRPLADHES